MKTLLSLALVTLLFTSSCSKPDTQNAATNNSAATPAAPPASAAKEGQGRGLVIATNPATKTLTVAHNDIPGIMDAMTMDYQVQDAAMLAGLAKGDSITFTVKMPVPGEFSVTAIAKIPSKK